MCAFGYCLVEKSADVNWWLVVLLAIVGVYLIGDIARLGLKLWNKRK